MPVPRCQLNRRVIRLSASYLDNLNKGFALQTTQEIPLPVHDRCCWCVVQAAADLCDITVEVLADCLGDAARIIAAHELSLQVVGSCSGIVVAPIAVFEEGCSHRLDAGDAQPLRDGTAKLVDSNVHPGFGVEGRPDLTLVDVPDPQHLPARVEDHPAIARIHAVRNRRLPAMSYAGQKLMAGSSPGCRGTVYRVTRLPRAS